MILKVVMQDGRFARIVNSATGELVQGIEAIRVDMQVEGPPRAIIQLVDFPVELLLVDPKVIEGKPILRFQEKDLFRGRLRKFFYPLAESMVRFIAWVCRK